ncbi:hypothetical protein MKW98_005887 [Papaver atlanticum]|uniref:Pectinesterase n=1 Tax=Papaver atlanticum TaxID=357466 RepID=A0AAD4TDM1_9MAGN|nr:hypothetical protein MKW98_005887 [Papaver atlanticum]
MFSFSRFSVVEGYQDSLYAKKYNQFYRECDILGTVDFIFGSSTTFLQNCRIYCRKPNVGQSITITTDGRNSLDMNSGIVLHNCSIIATEELENVKHNFSSYFGRWLPWNEILSTLTYIEYEN